MSVLSNDVETPQVPRWITPGKHFLAKCFLVRFNRIVIVVQVFITPDGQRQFVEAGQFLGAEIEELRAQVVNEVQAQRSKSVMICKHFENAVYVEKVQVPIPQNQGREGIRHGTKKRDCAWDISRRLVQCEG